MVPVDHGLAGLPDEVLAARIGEGDREAFAALYERHADAIYDFVVRLVRDRDAAGDTVQATFVKAWDALSDRRPVSNVRAWLFAVARNAGIDELRRRKRLVTTDDDRRLDHGGNNESSDPVATVAQDEIAVLVWESAAALTPDDYALLDLHVRRGLSADDLARELGLRKGAVYTRVSRLRDALEEAVVANLLARHGRRACSVLDSVLASLRDSTPRRVRKAIRGHLRTGCDTCEETRRRVAAPAALFGSLPPIPLGLAAREELWEHISLAIDDPSRPARRRPRKVARLVTLLVVIALLLVGTALIAMAGGGGPAKPRDPINVHSTTHEVSRASTIDRIGMAWNRQPAATAYSTRWSRNRAALPDTVPDLPGTAISTVSPPLEPGAWWFVLRTRGEGDRWTSTVVRGPYVVIDRSRQTSTVVTTTTTSSTVPVSTTQPSPLTTASRQAAPTTAPPTTVRPAATTATTAPTTTSTTVTTTSTTTTVPPQPPPTQPPPTQPPPTQPPPTEPPPTQPPYSSSLAGRLSLPTSR